ncbi:Long chain base biosynthesis protein [Actinidia chinensis var. chinensis]|uniref:serine C-palmitoyltransferase n=1 Tax=Actinidia chinensis var. chinensis TaxID=1590841 RepID=A0A2R6R517_ACTCC|nr:Long chain base biosynthesis protein [Actinidia chinensis var. chinensis]
MNTMASVTNIVNATLDMVTLAFEAPFARAVVFGVHISGHLFVEGLLAVVIFFLLSQKSYKPPKRPLTKKEIDELCEEWVPESLIPPITEEMQCEPHVLERDEGVHWGIQNGVYLSRSTIVYFKHNDMESLQSTLEKVTLDNKRAKKLRRYIVVEAIYQNSGQIAPLDEIVRLKEKYRFRVLLDESNSLGVLGSSGRGLTEHHGVPVEKIDIITAAMGHALATEGGFCTGRARVIDHQRLSSSGYVFSASLPPYLASAAITAIDILQENPDLITKLKKNISMLCKGLLDIQGLEVMSDAQSPIVFLRLKNSTGSSKNDLQLLKEIADRALKEDSVFVVTSKRSTLDKCRLPVGIRLFVSAGHSESDLLKASESLKRVAAVVLSRHN